MGIGNLGWAEILVIAVFVLIFFGPQRLPEVARSMGHAMREFRRSLNQIQRELEEADPRTHVKRAVYGDDPKGPQPWETTGERPAPALAEQQPEPEPDTVEQAPDDVEPAPDDVEPAPDDDQEEPPGAPTPP